MKSFEVGVISSLLFAVAMSPSVEAIETFDFPEVTPDPDAPSYLFVDGQPFFFLKRGETTNGQYVLSEITVPPGQGAPPHFHTLEDEWFYVVEGNLRIMKGENTYADATQIPGVNAPKDLLHALDAPAGTLIYGERNRIHGVLNVSDEPARLRLVWNPSGFESIFEDIGIPAPDRSKPSPVPPEYPFLFAQGAARHGVVGSFSFDQFGDIVVDNTLADEDNHADELLALLAEDATPVPESSSLCGVLAFGALGAISILKHKCKSVSRVPK
jgi:mannose-6-phosphate isomerase-like protein (cupin superfamily)